MKYTTAKGILVRMRTDVLSALNQDGSSDRFSAIFDLVTDDAAWQLVDGGHTRKTVLPFLIHMTKHHFDKGAFIEMETK